ncbi:MAG: arginine--tRNA ligase [Candidatus Omnitrophota bacterium]
MKQPTEKLLISIIKDSLKELDWQLPDKELYLDLPQDARFGDLASNAALKLTKVLKKSPREIAQSIVHTLSNHLQNCPLKGYVKDIKIEGAGFINFYLNDSYFHHELKSLLLEGKDYLRADSGKGKKVLIEFVRANPTGPLSVAHARQAAVGDALANILAFLGFEVQKEYYLNDEGNQINILGRSVDLRLKELLGESIEFPEDHYQGDYIYDIAREIMDKKLQVKDHGEFAGEHILNIIKQELNDFGVRFDNWYSQKALGKSGKVEKALDDLKKKGFIYEQDGAVWFKSTELGDDKDRVVIKSDKTYTYLTPDIAYHQEKYNRGFDWLINLWGPDHHGYISRLKASVAAFGHDPQSLSIIIVQLATIFREGNPVQMSTRKGQYITLREVLEETGPDAARFFFLMRRTSSHLDFDLDVAKKQTKENPVYYVQYAHARISSILNSYGSKVDASLADLSVLKEKEEIELMKKICQFSYILTICLGTQDPYMITIYLQELAEDFHKFYDLHRVLGQDEKVTTARIVLLKAAQIIIAAGLDLMGISKPEKM